MSTFRHVKTSMWQDPFYFNLCPYDKLFHNYLITNGKSTQCGIFEQSIKLMAIELGYDEALVLKQIESFITWGKLFFDPATNEFFLVSWLKHNFSASPSVMNCMENELKGVKSALMKEFWIQCIQSVYSVWGKEKEKEKEVKKENLKKKEEAQASKKSSHNISKPEEQEKLFLVEEVKSLEGTDSVEGKATVLDPRVAVIISYLNQKVSTQYRTDNHSITDIINQKLSMGYSLNDFYTVIDKKATEWLGTFMAGNLRPYTLFTTHFDDYLNHIPEPPRYGDVDRCSIFANTGFTKVS